MPVARPLVVVGGGLVAATVVRDLRRLAYDGPVEVVSDEMHRPYDRPPLSKQMLAGILTPAQLELLPADPGDTGTTLRSGCAAVGLDVADQRVQLADGSAVGYDRLVIATGSRARRLPSLPDLDGVRYLRSLDDSLALAAALPGVSDMVIIGAGFVGLEVAAVARARGVAVTVVEAAPRPLTRVLGPEAGHLVTDLHARHGVRILCSAEVEGLVGSRAVEGVRLAGGEVIPADLVLVGVGAVPNVEWLEGSGLVVSDGVVCDDRGRTSDPSVFAAGDVARWRNARTGEHVRVEQWQSATEQAGIVADALVGGDRRWDAVPYFWSDQYDCKIQLCGRAGPVTATVQTPRGPVVAFADRADEEAVVVGVLAMGNPRAVALGRRLVGAQASWEQTEEWMTTL